MGNKLRYLSHHRLAPELGLVALMLMIGLTLFSLQKNQNFHSNAATTTIYFTIYTHGIGQGGDSANPNSSGNANPITSQRILSVGVFNAQNVLVQSEALPITYSVANGSYTGTGDFGTLPSGSYTIAVRADQYLQKTATGIQTITAGQVNQIAPIFLITGDIDNNNQINIADYNILMGCYSDLTAAASCTSAQKKAADLTDDGNVNQLDYNLFIREIGNRSGETEQTPIQSGPSTAPVATTGMTPKPILTPTPTQPVTTTSDLATSAKKEIAMELVSSAENSSLNWKAQYAYIQDIGDGRGYTGGIIGFCSGTGDMLEVIQYYTTLKANNVLSKYIPALQKVNGTASHTGLDPTFQADWKTAATDTLFQQAQDHERDIVYFNPAVNQAKTDGLRALGQFIYYDAIVMHGPGTDPVSFGGIRATAMKSAKTPAQGGNEVTYLNAFLDARKAAMLNEAAHDDTSRVDTEQRVFVQQNNLDLNRPLTWKTYGDSYSIP